MLRSFIAVSLLVPLCSGCDDAPVMDGGPQKTVTYYKQHLPEANQLAQRCRVLDEQQQNQLSTLAYQEWQTSDEWVHCQTAISVSEAEAMREFVLRQGKPVSQKPAMPVASERAEAASGGHAVAP